MKYIVISAAKDEERYIENTLKSMCQQTIRPSLWLIVDDASKDNTCRIIQEYLKNHEWMKILKSDDDTERQPGTGVIKAFNLGYEQIKDINYDFIVKLDCDLKLGPDYFERIFKEFDRNQKLGIASGIYKEYYADSWRSISMPNYHAAGASKVIRKKCFEEIGGFVTTKGWDTLDEIRAQMLGWQSCHFPDIFFYHLKREGSGIGFLNTNAMIGEIFYKTGGSPIFFSFKCVYKMLLREPLLLGGFYQLLGYLRAWMKKEKIVNKEEERFYRSLLNKRILKAIAQFYNKRIKKEIMY